MPESLSFGRFHFQGQHENEQVLQVIHRHWFNICVHLGIVLVLSFLMLGSISSLSLIFPEVASASNLPFFLFVQNTLILSLWLYGFLVWIDYYFDVWIITNERIVNIEQRGLFNRSISELQFSRVQDVTASVDGIVPTMMNFGNVSVQTAAEEERFVFRQVADPFAVKDRVMTLSRQASREDMRAAISAYSKQ